MTPFFRAVEAHNEMLQAHRELEPTYYEPPWPASEQEAQAAREMAHEARTAQAGPADAADAAWAQVQADFPGAATDVEAEAG